jgi:hypothetical protein
MAAMPASTALAIGDDSMSPIGLELDACSWGWAPRGPSISRSCPVRRIALFVSLHKILVLFLELFITEQVVEDTHV